jgi:dipeptidyl aminopeptidase/acylaminoacyl peptidase
VARGWADGERVVTWGGSAGGYAALLLPALYPGRFKAAVALYAVTDHFATARSTHRLEAHYTGRLVGPLPAAYPLYRERSPIHRVADIRVPVLLLHGDQDVAVTPGQAEQMAAALRAAGVPVVFHLYPGEGHGWSRAATQRDYLARMDTFLEDYALLR